MDSDAAVYDDIVLHLNRLPYVYASQHTHLQQDNSVLTLNHPLLFHTFKPVQTTGDGSCLFHALSLTLTGTETCTDLMRLLAVYALAKHRATMMGAFEQAFPMCSQEQHQEKFNSAIHKAVEVPKWGIDPHLFALSLLLDRPILQYNTDRNHGLPHTLTVH